MRVVEQLQRDGFGTRVVSMPCWELFEAQDEKYRRIERELHMLPYELPDPETAFQFVRGWLNAKGRDFGPMSGGDGSDVKGYRVEITSDFYEVMTITARYNYYSK